MAGLSQKRMKQLGTVFIGLLLLTNTGCLAGVILGAGAAAAGGAYAGYAWTKGQLYRDYPADFPRSEAAVRAAMAESQLPLLSQELGAGQGGAGNPDNRWHHGEDLHHHGCQSAAG